VADDFIITLDRTWLGKFLHVIIQAFRYSLLDTRALARPVLGLTNDKKKILTLST